MKAFAELVQTLSRRTGTNDKLAALRHYFSTAGEADKIWVLALFTGKRPRRTVTSTQLREWCMEVSGLPAWLFEECHHTVGDLGETIALLLPEQSAAAEDFPLHYWMNELMRLETAGEPAKKQRILQAWQQLQSHERFVFNKLITGSFRIGVSRKTIINALAAVYEVEPARMAHRVSGNWLPQEMTLGRLLSEEQALTDISRPYPFYLAYALEGNPHSLGEPSAWQAEWKWDGIRGQIIKRAGELFVWSRGEELVTEKFPEYREIGKLLPDGTALDGEILPFAEGRPLSFQVLQTRIGRKNITRKILQEAPVVFIVYDLLEWEGRDIREQPLAERRALLEELLATTNLPALLASPVIDFRSWEELAEARESSRENHSEGIMLKRLASSYQAGRKRGDWWKWKIDPFSIDAVMIYAQKGHGRRSNLYTDYTFAVKDAEGRLVPFTKAYSGLTDREIAEVDAFVRRNGLEKFGPVRTVKPELVFEIAFEGIAASNRHKSGVALRFPRISRWRKDKQPSEINTLEDLRKMLELYGK